eukprot:CAMPEP_0206040786 /NCGR_PEP_ID=MMETSP1466-20131121/5579_1 /ASSEMBLY_ACC=CAM_ASM_001126 /TAXON_ID=44452 /ORGANISM="Pavlova gyrans, Strain CCMP608" /LENGTH=288 /DNA_ID=CAMNT_0053415467 /DNA_START=58 /DNA_END=925 /DNA_ORIENTATION=+
MIAASYQPKEQKDFTEFLDELDPSHTAEERYGALFHVAHTITKATEAGGTGKHAATLESCKEEPVVRYLVGMYEDYGSDDQIPPFILSTLVNISCIDPQLIIDGGGFELLLKHIVLPPPTKKDPKPSDTDLKNQYYSLAGIYNLSENDSCAQQIIERGVDKVLEKLAKSPNEETSKHATFTLKNLSVVRGGESVESKKKDGSSADYIEQQMKKLTSMFPKLGAWRAATLREAGRRASWSEVDGGRAGEREGHRPAHVCARRWMRCSSQAADWLHASMVWAQGGAPAHG